MATGWLPRGYELSNGVTVRKSVVCSETWQILSASGGRSALLVKPELWKKWIDAALIDEEDFEEIHHADQAFRAFCSEPGEIIGSIQNGPFPENIGQIRPFSIAFRDTRSILAGTPLGDGIYVEALSRILPSWSGNSADDDALVFGTWTAEGVHVSVNDTSRYSKLMSWAPRAELFSLIEESGIPLRSGDSLVKAEEKEDVELEDDQQQPVHTRRKKKTPFALPGRPELESFFNEQIIDIIQNEEKYRRMGIDFPGAVILHGPPGCGKTFAVERLIEYLDWPNYSIDSGSIGSPFIHDTSKKIAEVFDTAIENAPSVIVIDEMEAFLTDRSAAQGTGTHHVEEVAEFLRRIPEATKNHVLVIAMTNMVDTIDPAILRRGRFDHIIEVKMPTAEEVLALLKSLLAKLPVSDDVDLEQLAQTLEERPLSDAAFVVKEAGRLAVKADKEVIDNEVIQLACKALPKAKNTTNRIGFGS